MSESQSTSDYPGALDTWETLTDKEDLAEVVDINKIKAALAAIQAELGVDPAGSLATIVARLAMIQNIDGAVQKGTSFPVSGLVDGQAFYRTDQNVLYIYNGSTWDGQGQSLSNIIWDWTLFTGDLSAPSYGYTAETAINNQPTVITYASLFNKTTSAATLYRTKFRKLAGQTTATVWCYVAETSPSGTATFAADIGGATGSDTYTSATPGWIDFTVDISGLSDGTTYDASLNIAAGSTNDAAHLFGSIAIAT